MEYKFDQKPNTVFSPEGIQMIENIKKADYSVLVGKNNCGKSFLLKTLTQQIGKHASYIGPARYNNFNTLGYYSPQRNKKDDRFRQFLQQWQQENQNFDNSPINLQQAIAQLPDIQRQHLFSIVEELLGTKLEILYTVEDNTMSQKYVSSDGHNISFTSSGFRLVTTIVTCLLDTDYDTYLIDEPELGISPEAQGTLADFLFDRSKREKYFSHIKRLIFATHSTIFLDRLCLENNYSLEKKGDVINIKQTKTITDFNNIHFFLLGNRLESLYLPSAIILVEGKCDYHYISKILELKYPEFQFSIINANSDSRIKEIVNIAGSLFKDLQKSPYRNRIIAILDQVHDKSVEQTLTKAGVLEENIIIWGKNGIEYYYPEKILNDIYGLGGILEINNDDVSKNGINYKKWNLCEIVSNKIDINTTYPDEINEKLFSRIRTMIVG